MTENQAWVLYCQPSVVMVMPAHQAFSREETTQWQHVCKTLKRKKKVPRACSKKNPPKKPPKTRSRVSQQDGRCSLWGWDVRRSSTTSSGCSGCCWKTTQWSTGRYRTQVTGFGRVIFGTKLMISILYVLSLGGYCLTCGFKQREAFQRCVPENDGLSLDFVLWFLQWPCSLDCKPHLIISCTNDIDNNLTQNTHISHVGVQTADNFFNSLVLLGCDCILSTQWRDLTKCLWTS